MSWYFLILHETGRRGDARVCEQPPMIEIRDAQLLDSMLRSHAVFGTTAFAFPCHAAPPHAYRSGMSVAVRNKRWPQSSINSTRC